ncbi:expressed unknown protein [Seminavis robusta]|uniref:Uncharacterized protein n=1 Tax=Seminavis robusta TaxID=568900 RepID=A0A9N8HCG6_9STRA|nr:expressed unknown protein [Seminavis robusta]|eukprot:Sro408_g137010.1 n/a (117) ;mRNA; f:47342-47766
MPIKFSKDVSTHLFKYIRTIDIKFNALDARATSAKELIRRMKAPRFSKANSKLKVLVDVNSKPDPPSVLFKMVDESELFFDSREFDIEEMMFKVHLTTMQLDNQFEIDGKDIDEID